MLGLQRGLCSLVLGAVAASVGCGPPGLEVADTEGDGTTYAEAKARYCIPADPKFDVLFVVDDSISMGPFRSHLAANLPAFTEILEQEGVEADYRIAVTTTSVTGPGCEVGNDGRLLWSSCRERLDALAPGADVDGEAFDATDQCLMTCQAPSISTAGGVPWLASDDGQPNVDVTTRDAITCGGQVDAGGCPYEQPLEALRLAVTRMHDTSDPAFGFLRDDASFVVIFMTNEDDCSIQHAEAFDPEGNRALWPDPSSDAPQSGICWNAGVRCTEDGDGDWNDCAPANLGPNGQASDATAAVLTPVQEYVELIRKLREDAHPANDKPPTVVGLVAGVPYGYQTGMQDIEWRAPVEATDAPFGAEAACTSLDSGVRAYPPPRMLEFVDAFFNPRSGPVGHVFSVCAEDWTGVLQPIADAIEDQFRPHCFSPSVLDTDLSTPGLQPDCRIARQTENGSIRVPPCIDGQLPPGDDLCVELLVDDDLYDVCVDRGNNLQVEFVRDPTASHLEGSCIDIACLADTDETAEDP